MDKQAVPKQKTQLVVAMHYQCFLNYCWKNNIGPRSFRIRYVHEINQLRGYDGNNAEIVIVCGGPDSGPPPKMMTASRSNARAWAQWSSRSRAISRLFQEIRMLNVVYDVPIRYEECR